jgi:antirestriction factor ArdC-like protein
MSKKRTPAEARAWRAELSKRCDAFLARNDAESLSFAKIDGGFYSDRNAALIAVTAEDAGLDPTQITAVGSYGCWQSIGRQVRKGSDALRVWAPAGRREARDADPETGTEAQKARKFFKPVAVFAFEQTDPIEVTATSTAA